MNQNIWEPCDIEVFPNFFSYIGFDIQNKKWNVFVISEWRNDYLELYNHIKNKNRILVGYNIDNYDYPVLHHLVNHFEEYRRMPGWKLAMNIKNKSDSVLSNDFNTVADRNKHCLVIDLFTMWHFNNLAKLTS